MSIVEQAGRVHDAAGGSLSRELAGAVMEWAREAKAFRHLVSFEVLDDAVSLGLGGSNSRRDVSSEDMPAVGDAVRTWIVPHLREGADVGGLDAAIAAAFANPRAPDAKGRDDVEPTIVSRSGLGEGR